MSLPAWPPSFTPAQLASLHALATTYALAHGLAYLPPSPPPGPGAPQAAVYAPLSLVPAPFPRVLFERARALQGLYNQLYARVAMDVEFLDRVMGAEEGVGAVDEFTGALWRGWKALRDANAVPAVRTTPSAHFPRSARSRAARAETDARPLPLRLPPARPGRRCRRAARAQAGRV
jgi:hypothetical protein